jgi:hypothetical protein
MPLTHTTDPAPSPPATNMITWKPALLFRVALAYTIIFLTLGHFSKKILTLPGIQEETSPTNPAPFLMHFQALHASCTNKEPVISLLMQSCSNSCHSC